MIDVQTPGEDDFVNGNLCMAMPLYRMGDLKGAIKNGVIGLGQSGRKQRVEVAHGLLSAVAFLHDNHIIHRDIKTDNVMITVSEEDGKTILPVLIDFSLAKFIGGENALVRWIYLSLYIRFRYVLLVLTNNMQLPPGSTHTGSIGTPTYTAPEVVAKESYGLPSDMWSVGVVLLESLIGELTVDRDKAAAKLIEEKKTSLNKSPFVELICGLLEPDVDKRLTAREALALPIFEKFGFQVPPVKIVDVKSAIPTEDEDSDDENNNVTNSTKTNSKKKQQKLSPRERLIKKLCAELDCKNPKTELAAALYASKMEEVDDEMDDIANTQTLLDCVVVASRFYEEELLSLEELAEDGGECYKSFKDFDIETYQDNEAALLMQMDYSLYLRN